MQKIADLLKKECCVFIGAGIPQTIGFPLWSELASKLVSITWDKRASINLVKQFNMNYKQELEEQIQKGKLLSVINYCKSLLKESNLEDDYKQEIQEIFYDEEKYEKAKRSDVYLELFNLLRHALIIQTNIDMSLEYCYQIPAIHNLSLPANIKKLSLPKIVYLHGVVTKPDTWILTTEEYNNFYQQNSNFTSFIQNVFTDYDVLFLGYSLSDKEILDQIARVKGAGRQYILVLEETDRAKYANDIFDDNLKCYDISVFRYNIEKEGYEEFLVFLQQLNALITPSAYVAQPDQDGSTIDG